MRKAIRLTAILLGLVATTPLVWVAGLVVLYGSGMFLGYLAALLFLPLAAVAVAWAPLYFSLVAKRPLKLVEGTTAALVSAATHSFVAHAVLNPASGWDWVYLLGTGFAGGVFLWPLLQRAIWRDIR